MAGQLSIPHPCIEGSDMIHDQSIQINLHKYDGLSEEQKAKVHIIPMQLYRIKKLANDKHASELIVEPSLNGELSASFRGVSLNGVEFTIPKNYVGLILREGVDVYGERAFYTILNFDEFIHWDYRQSKREKIRQAMDWIDIAEALHAPITKL